MAHRRTGDTVRAVPANCSASSSEPAPSLPILLLPLVTRKPKSLKFVRRRPRPPLLRPFHHPVKSLRPPCGHIMCFVSWANQSTLVCGMTVVRL